MLKVVIVGCGKIADAHVEEIQKMPEYGTVVAVCDRELLMAEQLAARYAIARFYDDFETMLAEERPDVVHITTPPRSHLSIASVALDAGCHVYVEKPLAPNYQDSKRLLERAREANRIVTVGYTYLLDPPALEARRMVADGLVGEVVHVESFYGYNLAGPYGTAILGDPLHWVHHLPGKLLQNNLDHLLYKVSEFVDDELPAISAFGQVRRPQRFGDERDHMIDELRLSIVGARVTAFGTFSSHIQPAGHFARIYGTKDTLHVDYLARTVTREGGAQLPSAFGRLLPAFDRAAKYTQEGLRNLGRFAHNDFHFFAGLANLIRDFYLAITNGTPPPVSERDMLRMTKWMDEIFRQVPQGGSSAAQEAQ